ncbi:MAG: lipoyl synthase [Rhodanobacteraceae bacterium]|nr:lipoyl synthase [Rhodanobacteraceae bacterium]
MDALTSRPLQVRSFGRLPYEPVWRAMQRFTDHRDAGTLDELWILEHDPVFTLGQAGKWEHVLLPGDIPVVPVDRGGQVTYHGPGQLVAYPLFDLRRLGISVRELVQRIEQSIIDTLARYDIVAARRDGAPGVYVGDAKIAALGLRVRRGCSFHGLAFNVAMDLDPFTRINPCGYQGLAVTQVLDCGGPSALSVVATDLIDTMCAQFGLPRLPRMRAFLNPRTPEMSETSSKTIPLNLVEASLVPGAKQIARDKIARNPVTFDAERPMLRKPDWIRVRLPSTNAVQQLKNKLRESALVTVCEEASCPNIHECFAKGTATFMVLGEVCTRRCSFCDVAHGRPKPADVNEPKQLAQTIADMQLRYVVITSVDRDDLMDGGAGHFADCIRETRALSPAIRIEILTPDFRGKGRVERALAALAANPPDVFNHNLETVRRVYREVRPGADYDWSLRLLQQFKAEHPTLPTKSGIMLGLGETLDEVREAMADLRAHAVDMITVGQYLQPSRHHHPVERYWTPDEFKEIETIGYALGFSHVASGPLVRSSYHADQMAHAAGYA